jgi:hypothetical protein
MDVGRAIRVIEAERNRRLLAAHAILVEDVEKWLKRGAEVINLSRSEIQRSRNLMRALSR